MHTYILRFFLLFAASATNLSAQIPIYQNPDMPIEAVSYTHLTLPTNSLV